MPFRRSPKLSYSPTIRREGAKNTMRGAWSEKRHNPRGSAWGLVVLADFKSVGVAALPGWVGSIPTRFRQTNRLETTRPDEGRVFIGLFAGSGKVESARFGLRRLESPHNLRTI